MDLQDISLAILAVQDLAKFIEEWDVIRGKGSATGLRGASEVPWACRGVSRIRMDRMIQMDLSMSAEQC